MKVLEVYPDYCWSLQSEDQHCLNRLREATRVADERERTTRLSEVSNGEAYLFPGDVVELDFAENFFDEVVIDGAVTPVKATLVRYRAKRWVKPHGTIRVSQEKHANERLYLPLRQRLHRLASRRWAQARVSVAPI